MALQPSQRTATDCRRGRAEISSRTQNHPKSTMGAATMIEMSDEEFDKVTLELTSEESDLDAVMEPQALPSGAVAPLAPEAQEDALEVLPAQAPPLPTPPRRNNGVLANPHALPSWAILCQDLIERNPGSSEIIPPKHSEAFRAMETEFPAE